MRLEILFQFVVPLMFLAIWVESEYGAVLPT